jgi:hypothetical protein
MSSLFSILLTILYIVLVTYSFGTLGAFWSVLLLLLLVFAHFILKVKTQIELRYEIVNHSVIFISSLILSLIIPSLVYMRSDGNLDLTLTILLLVSPCSLIIGYLWFRFFFFMMRWFVNKLF